MPSDSSDTGESEGLEPTSHEPRECMACRGSGQVISSLDGTPNSVTCPWCAGAGVRVPGIDAQGKWLAQRDADGAVSDAAPELSV